MRRTARARAVDADLDTALARRIEDRDPEVFDTLYDQYAGAAYGIARRVLRDRALAEDVVQEAFLELWTRPERFDASRGTLRTFLLTIVHRRAVDAVRRRVARPAVCLDGIDVRESSEEDAQEAALRRADADRVHHALAALPLEQRRALLLAYWGGNTQTEIANLTGVPLGTVKSRVFKGFQRLRSQLRRMDGDTPGDAR